jgi:hypothetical protein
MNMLFHLVTHTQRLTQLHVSGEAYKQATIRLKMDYVTE